eukprot:m51a1_g8247 hypothetical protein (326) ;mRNA; r:129194-130412
MVLSLGLVLACCCVLLIASAAARSAGLFSGRRCPYSPDLTGKIAVVTGTTSGIGLATAKRLAQLGASVYLLNRNPDRARRAACEVEAVSRPGAAVVSVQCDLADLDSVKRAAAAVLARTREVHLLVNNAGILCPPLGATKQGWELHYGTNHLGHFCLTTSLLPALIAGKARVVCVSSSTYAVSKIDFENMREADVRRNGTYGATGFRFYGMSKLANALFVRELQRRYGNTGITAFAVHPGVIETNIASGVPSFLYKIGAVLFMKTPEQGAQTQLFCALAPLDKLVPGGYHSGCAPKKPSANALDDATACRLWDESEMQIANSVSQ